MALSLGRAFIHTATSVGNLVGINVNNPPGGPGGTPIITNINPQYYTINPASPILISDIHGSGLFIPIYGGVTGGVTMVPDAQGKIVITALGPRDGTISQQIFGYSSLFALYPDVNGEIWVRVKFDNITWSSIGVASTECGFGFGYWGLTYSGVMFAHWVAQLEVTGNQTQFRMSYVTGGLDDGTVQGISGWTPGGLWPVVELRLRIHWETAVDNPRRLGCNENDFQYWTGAVWNAPFAGASKISHGFNCMNGTRIFAGYIGQTYEPHVGRLSEIELLRGIIAMGGNNCI